MPICAYTLARKSRANQSISWSIGRSIDEANKWWRLMSFVVFHTWHATHGRAMWERTNGHSRHAGHALTLSLRFKRFDRHTCVDQSASGWCFQRGETLMSNMTLFMCNMLIYAKDWIISLRDNFYSIVHLLRVKQKVSFTVVIYYLDTALTDTR